MAVAPEDAIRARRKLTNKLIAGHDAARLRPFFAADARLIAGDGGLILGGAAIVEAFARQFADPDFETYVRDAETVEIDRAGDRAAETGRWTARWKGGEMSGRYLACWRRQTGQWVIESELYITLAET
ncbi:nuclear transport factor 2 family protein [Phenylobacterium sp.]|uniref:YybH family protein n=1 Tax=Phenylobacterium sp. TaxID=1871053 RepID=UPI002DF1233B|nr:nuclear transport factor 2 family protein [Phenylobacterium sp.]